MTKAFIITLVLLVIIGSGLALLMFTSPHPGLQPLPPERQKEILISLREHRNKKKEKL